MIDEHPFTTWLRETLAWAIINMDTETSYPDSWVSKLVVSDQKMLEVHRPDGLDCCVNCTFDIYPCPTLRIRGEFWATLRPEGYDETWRPER